MADTADENSQREEDKLRVDFLEKMEIYQIMAEVFFEFIPNEKKFKALAHALERIQYEIK